MNEITQKNIKYLCSYTKQQSIYLSTFYDIKKKGETKFSHVRSYSNALLTLSIAYQ